MIRHQFVPVFDELQIRKLQSNVNLEGHMTNKSKLTDSMFERFSMRPIRVASSQEIESVCKKYKIKDQKEFQKSFEFCTMFHTLNSPKRKKTTPRQIRSHAKSISKHANGLIDELSKLDALMRGKFFHAQLDQYEDEEKADFLNVLIEADLAEKRTEKSTEVMMQPYIIMSAIQVLAWNAEEVVNDIDELEETTGLKTPPRKSKANDGLKIAIGGLRKIWEEQTGKPFTRQFDDPIVEDGEELLPISEAADFCVDCMALIDREVTTRMIDRAMRENITSMGVSSLK